MTVYILFLLKGVTVMKGCQKKVIFIKNTESRIFDEAYFIISRESEKSYLSEENLVSEANRIIERSLSECESKAEKDVLRRFWISEFPFSLVRWSRLRLFLYRVPCFRRSRGKRSYSCPPLINQTRQYSKI